tara:strand:- start:971 stop:1414 length:444 start_codon:yes stop_codon:yes gene_type:complete
MFGMKLKYTRKFYLGVSFFFANFLIGAIAKVIFFIYLDKTFWRWFSIIIYVISWIMLVIGVWWIGEEYAHAVKKYFTYKHYHKHIKKGTKKAIQVGAAGTKKAIRVGAAGTKKVVSVGVGGTKKMVRGTKIVGGKVKNKLKNGRRKN